MCSTQIPHLRPTEYSNNRLSKSKKTVHRAYGGTLSAKAVRERYVPRTRTRPCVRRSACCSGCAGWGRVVQRTTEALTPVCELISFLNPIMMLNRIVRAFLVEEQKIVKKVLKMQKAKTAAGN